MPLFLCLPALLCGQKTKEETPGKKTVSYLVIKGDDLSHVAARFHIHTGTLRHINKISLSTHLAYPGMVLGIPVSVSPRIWNPTEETGLQTKDRKSSADYEVNKDQYDSEIREDFAELSEMHDDQAQFETLSAHINGIDHRIRHLTQAVDSMKRADRNTQSNNPYASEIEAMRAARLQHGLRSRSMNEIDSLNHAKASIADICIKLRNKITEYEYLTDNADYAKENYQREETTKDIRWTEQIMPESHGNFIQPPAAAAQAMRHHADITINTEVSKVDTIVIDEEVMTVDTEALLSVLMEETKDITNPSAPEIVADIPAEKMPETKKDTVPTIEKHPIQEPLTEVHISKPITIMKVDIASLDTRSGMVELHDVYKRELELYPLSQKAEAMAKPAVDSSALAMRDEVRLPPISRASPLLASNDRSSGLETRYDPSLLRRERKVNPDPLAIYPQRDTHHIE